MISRSSCNLSSLWGTSTSPGPGRALVSCGSIVAAKFPWILRGKGAEVIGEVKQRRSLVIRGLKTTLPRCAWTSNSQCEVKYLVLMHAYTNSKQQKDWRSMLLWLYIYLRNMKFDDVCTVAADAFSTKVSPVTTASRISWCASRSFLLAMLIFGYHALGWSLVKRRRPTWSFCSSHIVCSARFVSSGLKLISRVSDYAADREGNRFRHHTSGVVISS